MSGLNLNALWLWPLLAVFVLMLMSFQDPFVVALAAALAASMDPTRRLILALGATPTVPDGVVRQVTPSL